jgi:hypothetical protein
VAGRAVPRDSHPAGDAHAVPRENRRGAGNEEEEPRPHRLAKDDNRGARDDGRHDQQRERERLLPEKSSARLSPRRSRSRGADDARAGEDISQDLATAQRLVATWAAIFGFSAPKWARTFGAYGAYRPAERNGCPRPRRDQRFERLRGEYAASQCTSRPESRPRVRRRQSPS